MEARDARLMALSLCAPLSAHYRSIVAAAYNFRWMRRTLDLARLRAVPDELSPPLEPLFASNARLWLRVWGATQAAALVISVVVFSGGAGAAGRFFDSARTSDFFRYFAALVAYHVVGLVAYDRVIRRTWAVLLFVPLGWVLILASLEASGVFGLLIFGAILQGFIFLPFAWAITTLALVVSAFAGGVAFFDSRGLSALTLSRVGGILATGIMIGTVLLYIHRSNREAAVRNRLLRQLDEAQRDLAERAREAGVQEERQRLARDIHDTLAQGFTSVIKHLEAIELSLIAPGKTSDVAMQQAVPHLKHAQAVSRTSLAEIRRLVWALRPAELEDSSLGAALRRIVAQWSEANAVPATVSIETVPSLLPDADVIFLRATQESLSNVARHANASSVTVTLQRVDELVLLTVEDDGAGFANVDAAATGSLGLSGMRERVRRFGGRVMIDSVIGEGTSLTVAMPLALIAVSEPA